MNMDEQIFLSLLVYKDIIKDAYKKSDETRELRYRVLGPMMGTLEDDVFINTNDKRYKSIEKGQTNMDDSIRYAYYSLLSLKEAKEKYNTDNVEEIVKMYNDEHQKEAYYVINNKDSDPVILKYDEEKLKRKYKSDVARPI